MLEKDTEGITVNGSVFGSVAKNTPVVLTVEDIEDEVFWMEIFCCLRAIFPALKALQFCDSNHPNGQDLFPCPSC